MRGLFSESNVPRLPDIHDASQSQSQSSSTRGSVLTRAQDFLSDKKKKDFLSDEKKEKNKTGIDKISSASAAGAVSAAAAIKSAIGEKKGDGWRKTDRGSASTNKQVLSPSVRRVRTIHLL